MTLLLFPVSIYHWRFSLTSPFSETKLQGVKVVFVAKYIQIAWGRFSHGETGFLGVVSRSGILTFENRRQNSSLFIGFLCFFEISPWFSPAFVFPFVINSYGWKLHFICCYAPLRESTGKFFSSYFTQMLGGQNSPCFGIFLWIGARDAALDIISTKLCKI